MNEETEVLDVETEDDGLVEEGTAKQMTKGMALGIAHDPGIGWVFP